MPKTRIGYGQEAQQILDLYLPDEKSGMHPVLVLVHGGAFRFGDQEMPILRPIIEMGLEKGYAVASVDYRKTPEVTFPSPLADVKAAVRYLKAQASVYGLDAERLTIWGESAGAYLALMTALTPAVSELDGELLSDVAFSSQVSNLVSFYAPVHFYQMQADFVESGKLRPGFGKFESDLLGVEDVFAEQSLSAPAYWKTYVSQLPMNFSLKAWIQVGDTNDEKVPYQQSETFARELSHVAGVTVHYGQIVGAGHEDSLFYTTENLECIFTFLEQ